MTTRNSDVASVPTRLLDTAGAAQFLGVAVQTLHNWRVSGRGPAFRKHGNCVRYAVEDLEAWSNARRYESTSARAA